MHKRHLVNPRKSGPFHHRAPSRILHRAVRGMIPHPEPSAASEQSKSQEYAGEPPPSHRNKKGVIPDALRVLRLKPGRKYATLKRISSEVGWKYQDIVDKLEAKRVVKQQGVHERQASATKQRAAAATSAASQLEPINKQLEAYGY